MRLASHDIKKIELSAKCTDELICKLASGKAEWSMSVPPQEYDTDMQLIKEVREHIPNLIKHISVVEDENKKLRAAITRAQSYLEMYNSNRNPSNVAWADDILNEALGEVENGN